MSKCYKNAKVYKIIDNTNGYIYIGSTCSPLCKRLAYHKQDFYKWKNGYGKYISSFKILENENYDIILLEECPCENNEQLRMKEREWIDNLECVNSNKSYTSKEEKQKQIYEYYEKNKNLIYQYQKEYYEKNKLSKIQYQKKYNEKNKNLIYQYQKKYHEKNKEKLLQQQKQYYDNNKEKIREKKKEISNCPICNKEMNKSSINRHIKTKHY